jgi:hypothetical protein
MTDMNIPPIPPDQSDTGMFPYEPPEHDTAGSWLSSFLRNPGRTINRVVKKVFREVRDTVADVADGLTHAVREVVDTVGDVVNNVGSNVVRPVIGLIGGVVRGSGGDQPAPPPPAENLPPTRTADNPNFMDGDSDNDHSALTVGTPFTYQVLPNTFSDPEGGTITLSLKEGSVLPPGLTFNPATGVISGTPSGLTNASLRSQIFGIAIIGTDPAGNTKEDGMILEVKVPNRGPERTREIEDIDFTVGESPRILINMKKHFRDPDGDNLRFTAENLPDGMTMQAEGPWLYGKPTAAFDGRITITAHDSVSGQTMTQQFQLTATMPNQAPVRDQDISFEDIQIGEAVDLPVPSDAFSDPEGETLTLTATGLPDGLRLLKDDATGIYRIIGTPTAEGQSTVTITARDPHGATVFQQFNWNVDAAAPPELPPQEPQDSTPPPDPVPQQAPAPALQPDPAPPTPTHTVHRAASAAREILTGDGSQTDVFILSHTPGTDTSTDVIQNFQQGVDKIQIPGITTVAVLRVDTDGDDRHDSTAIAKLHNGAPVAGYAVLEGFTGTLTLDDFDASGLDPSLTPSVTEMAIM